MIRLGLSVLIHFAFTSIILTAQVIKADSSLSRHPFLYAGEWQDQKMVNQKMFIVRGGKIVWEFNMEEYGEYGDATLLSNGNVLFSRLKGVSEVTVDKKIVWNYDAPQGTEIHTAQPLGLDRVFICQNGTPAKAIIINKIKDEIEMEHELTTRAPTDPKSVHGQFRHIRLTHAGTYLVAHMNMGKVVEYDKDWNPIWQIEAPSAWAAIRLKNGNTLVSGNQHGYVREFNATGEVVWQIEKDDLPGIHLYTVQEINRLSNGNTVICNWFGGVKKEDWPKVVQVIEVTPDKKVVWFLRQWSNPNLGPASSIQLLDEPGIPEKGELQR